MDWTTCYFLFIIQMNKRTLKRTCYVIQMLLWVLGLWVFSDGSILTQWRRVVNTRLRAEPGFHLSFLSVVLLGVGVLLQAVQALCSLCWEPLNHQLVQNTHLGFNGQRAKDWDDRRMVPWLLRRGSGGPSSGQRKEKQTSTSLLS